MLKLAPDGLPDFDGEFTEAELGEALRALVEALRRRRVITVPGGGIVSWDMAAGTVLELAGSDAANPQKYSFYARTGASGISAADGGTLGSGDVSIYTVIQSGGVATHGNPGTTVTVFNFWPDAVPGNVDIRVQYVDGVPCVAEEPCPTS